MKDIRKFIVRYEPLEEGIEEGIEPGIQGEFTNLEEAEEAARQCQKWFNEPCTLEPAESADGNTVMVKAHHKVKKVKIRIEEIWNGEVVEQCKVPSEGSGKKQNTSSTKEVLPVG